MMRTTALAAGVSVRTVYKWLARYRSEVLSGLIDRRSVARVRSHALPSVWIDLFARCGKRVTSLIRSPGNCTSPLPP